ncbi:MAG: hypothetical protein ACK5F5_00245 [Gammaproteobacteria bacterium]|jgi:hypothetical protein
MRLFYAAGTTPVTEGKRLLDVEGREGRSTAFQVIRELLAWIENLEFFQNRIKQLLKWGGARLGAFSVLCDFLIGEPDVGAGDCTDQIPFVVFWAASGRQGWRVRFNPSALARLLDDLLARFDPSIRSLTKKLEVLDRRVDCVSKLYCVAARCEGFAVTE